MSHHERFPRPRSIGITTVTAGSHSSTGVHRHLDRGHPHLRRHWRRDWQFRQTGESVLAERYARGEIDEAEFRNRRKVLREKD